MIPVIVIFNGAIVASSPPAELVFGHVMAPLAPVVSRIAQRAALAGDDIVVVRGSHTCALKIGSAAMTCDGIGRQLPVLPYGRDDRAFVPLAEIARAFGGNATYDARSHTIEVNVAAETAVDTPAPYDPNALHVRPATIFTPSPAPATPTPRAVDSGSPQPRRTAIPVTPSRAPGD